MERIKRWIISIYAELRLFHQNPREYIYLFTYPQNRRVSIESYDPQVTKVGKFLVRKINKLYPELKVHFIGSAVLGIAGQRDIDLYAECFPRNFGRYIPGLISLFGPPTKIRRKFIQWRLMKNGCLVELLLIDPSTDMFNLPLKTFELMKNNKKILQEYKKIKGLSSGLSVREYHKKRLQFFNKILRL